VCAFGTLVAANGRGLQLDGEADWMCCIAHLKPSSKLLFDLHECAYMKRKEYHSPGNATYLTCVHEHTH